MNYFIRFIGSGEFGLTTAIIAVIVACVETVLMKFGKLPKWIENSLPLFIAVIGTVVSDVILNGRAELTEDVFYGGLMAYSLGTILSVSVRKILRGEKADDALFSLVEGITERVCRENSEAELLKITDILRSVATGDPVSAKTDIVAVLDGIKKDGVSSAEIAAVAEIILLSAQKLKKEK